MSKKSTNSLLYNELRMKEITGEAFYIMASDMHEHLGQAIAYARMNHVVPPWTARRQQGQ